MQRIFSQNIVAGFNDRKDHVRERLCKSYYPVIYNKVMQSTGGSPEAKDLVQNIFEKILRSKGRFKTIKNIENFIETVTENACIDHKRRGKLRQDNSGRVGKYFQDIQDYNNESTKIRAAFQSLIYTANERLPQKCRRIFLLYYVDDLSNREIAKLLGIAEKTVENHKNFALKKLRIEFRDKNDNGKILTIIFFLLMNNDQFLP
jgi:RNA polymerase sigma-70 factor (ECF subfamily)